MDASLFQETPNNSMNSFKFDWNPLSFPSNRNFKEYKVNDGTSFSNPDSGTESNPSDDSSTSPSSSASSPGGVADYPTGATLKFINDMLMEEELDGQTCMLQECLALQAQEKSFYDVLGKEYPADRFPPCIDGNVEIPDDGFSATSYNVSSTGSNLVGDLSWGFDQSDFSLTAPLYSPESTLLGPDSYSAINPFQGISSGAAEAVKPVSDGDASLLVTSRSYSVEQPAVRDERGSSPDGLRGRKSHQRWDDGYVEEERSSKHSATSSAEPYHSELFDEVLLGRCRKCEPVSSDGESKSQNRANVSVQKKGSNGRSGRGKKKGDKGEVVDLDTLLTQCAQAVAVGDQRTANELLQQIRQHSSPTGDASQRLAHYFANALETRLAGTSAPAYTPVVGSSTSAAQVIKAYQVYVKACPFKQMSNFFANRTIGKLTQNATKIHIIDFGILYGFQWPCLIQRLSERVEGRPELRITGIELPQPGFRPTERVEETGRRLAKYCDRFKVPFKYHCLAQKWETIKYEDLHIDRDEITIVNCLYRLKNLPDDTVVANSARDSVLNLIKRIKPDAFIHGAVNGSYNAPFFLTRFRETMFHFSSLFDMYEANVPREEEERMLHEKETFGREIMNVIACEGAARIERPETYKQWKARNLRAGFRQVPLDKEIFKNVRQIVKSDYNKDFVVDEDGQWMLQGWKGRIVYALSVWKPVQE